MTRRTLILALEILLEDLPVNARAGHAEEMDIAVGELPKIESASALGIAGRIAEALESEGGNEMLWEGLDASINLRQVHIMSAGWESEFVEPLP